MDSKKNAVYGIVNELIMQEFSDFVGAQMLQFVAFHAKHSDKAWKTCSILLINLAILQCKIQQVIDVQVELMHV